MAGRVHHSDNPKRIKECKGEQTRQVVKLGQKYNKFLVTFIKRKLIEKLSKSLS